MVRAVPMAKTVGFNPRTRVGCDFANVSYATCQRWFQSTHPCGVRLLVLSMTLPKLVSIHAPVWGATYLSLRQRALILFQSTHPCGVRLATVHASIVAGLFQSTHPCGVRLEIKELPECVACFNPRTRVGCDTKTTTKAAATKVSIHAPVWGATQTADPPSLAYLFQSTHPCGVRRKKFTR